MGGKAQADRLLLAQLLPRLGECWSGVLEEVLTTVVALLEQAFLVQLTPLSRPGYHLHDPAIIILYPCAPWSSCTIVTSTRSTSKRCRLDSRSRTFRKKRPGNETRLYCTNTKWYGMYRTESNRAPRGLIPEQTSTRWSARQSRARVECRTTVHRY
jgi:hypothetical protein